MVELHNMTTLSLDCCTDIIYYRHIGYIYTHRRVDHPVMPPKSRKRNKGKERKAKKADKVELERAKANEFWQRCLSAPVGCLHGCDNMAIQNDHPVSKFMDEFFIHWIRKQKGIAEILRDMLRVWTDSNHRELATQTFVLVGTNMLLAEEINSGALSMAKTIVLLEHFDSREVDGSLASSFYSRTAASKRRDLDRGSIGTERDLLKFYRKRLSCKCLKRMHLDARKVIPKTGRCANCRIEKERVDLSVCSKCMVNQYCSKECQVAELSAHKTDCSLYYNYDLFQKQLLEEKKQWLKDKEREKELELEKKELDQIDEELKKAKGFVVKEVDQSEKLKQIEERLSKLKKVKKKELDET